MLTLYYSPGSSAMATHIALHEVGRNRLDLDANALKLGDQLVKRRLREI